MREGFWAEPNTFLHLLRGVPRCAVKLPKEGLARRVAGEQFDDGTCPFCPFRLEFYR
jgi:hypothetical protein